MNGRDLLDLLETPVFLVDQRGMVVWMNGSARSKLPEETHDPILWSELYHRLPHGYIYRVHEYAFEEDKKGILIEGIPDTSRDWLTELDRLRRANEDLEKILNTVFDEIFVTDGNGVTLWVNEAAERIYGIKSTEIVGRTVFDLERERIFYPSVTAMVLRHRKRVTALQETKNGRRLVVTGSPVFDADGNITRVVCYTRDLTETPRISEVPAGSKPQRAGEDEEQGLIAESPAMKSAVALARKVARTEATVLLLGETGVGKNRFARFIHNLSSRRSGPFVEINCANIPESLFDSELFGYDGGAFTGARREGKMGKIELADGGTLFLNEVGELPLHVQGKMLDLLQERIVTRVGSVRPRKIDIRIIAATNRDLRALVDEGKFREDLYFRLHVVPITIPPLRERRQDIRVLAEVFLDRFCRKHGVPTKVLHPDAWMCFLEYGWPGNIREMENVIERLCITVEGNLILPEHLPVEMWERSGKHSNGDKMDGETARGAAARSALGIKRILEEVERELYTKAVEEYGSTYAIAKYLKVSQPTVVRKLKQYGLSTGREPHPGQK